MIELLMLHMFNMLMPAGYNLTGTNCTQSNYPNAWLCRLPYSIKANSTAVNVFTIDFGNTLRFPSMPPNTIVHSIVTTPVTANSIFGNITIGFGNKVGWFYNNGTEIPLWQQPPIAATTQEQKNITECALINCNSCNIITCTHWGYVSNGRILSTFWNQQSIPAVTPEQKCIERGGEWSFDFASFLNVWIAGAPPIYDCNK